MEAFFTSIEAVMQAINQKKNVTILFSHQEELSHGNLTLSTACYSSPLLRCLAIGLSGD